MSHLFVQNLIRFSGKCHKPGHFATVVIHTHIHHYTHTHTPTYTIPIIQKIGMSNTGVVVIVPVGNNNKCFTYNLLE